MDKAFTFFKQLSERFQGLQQGQKLAVFILVAAGIGSLFTMSLWLKTPDYQLLYAKLTPTDAAKIVDVLKSNKTPYELSQGGQTIHVPANAIYETRLMLASEGLPEGGEVGMEIFDDNSLGMTEFIQKLNYQRALQGELSRTIQSLDAVDQARVHLVIPKDTLFLKEKPRGKASVTIKIKPGKSITSEQTQGIVHLIAASVEGISAQDVVVVDLKGNLLSGDQASSGSSMRTSSNYQHKLMVEKELQDNIIRMLENALGVGTVIAQVSTTLDFELVDRTEEIFDPDSQVVRSEQLVSESTLGALPPGGVPGAQGLVPGGTGQAPAGGQPAKRDKENQTFNYEINKIVRQISKPIGTIKKLSVAVLIDGTVAGDPPEYQPRSEEDMAKYLPIIKSAIGYNEKRGDQIQLENIQFDRTFEQEGQERLAKAETMELVFKIVQYVLGALFILLFFTRVIRPMMNWMTTSLEVVPEAQGQLTSSEMDAIQEEKKSLGAAVDNEAAEIRKAVVEFADNDPKFTAGIVRKWLREKTPSS
ncbi:Flagellar M-ring protein FliF [hydrothermal vent metagenome]|uniref:Flagellar M-ring protein FliF n=1 Tax=hydrothermal vent metagenome TaxID=652676 RepID=A0A3B1CMN3_9ZZZZ